MDFGRLDYNKTIKDTSGTIPDDEPCILLRASELQSEEAVRKLAKVIEVDFNLPDQAAQLYEHARRMEFYAKKGAAPYTIPPDSIAYPGATIRNRNPDNRNRLQGGAIHPSAPTDKQGIPIVPLGHPDSDREQQTISAKDVEVVSAADLGAGQSSKDVQEKLDQK